jgi:hypothetical protein
MGKNRVVVRKKPQAGKLVQFGGFSIEKKEGVIELEAV